MERSCNCFNIIFYNINGIENYSKKVKINVKESVISFTYFITNLKVNLLKNLGFFLYYNFYIYFLFLRIYNKLFNNNHSTHNPWLLY